jgi:hypothetical protein
MNEQGMFSTSEAAGLLDVTVRAIENWRLKGLLVPVKVDGRCLYLESELKRFLGHPEQATLEQMYRTQDVADILCVSVMSVMRLRKSGKLKPVMVGQLVRYPEDEIARRMGVDCESKLPLNSGAGKHGQPAANRIGKVYSTVDVAEIMGVSVPTVMRLRNAA